jgi:hypoxanthine-guanine phosphoribosyltransferase
MCENETIPSPVHKTPSIEEYKELGVETDINNLQRIDPQSVPELKTGESIYILHPESEVLHKIRETATNISYDFRETENLSVLIIMNGGERFGKELLEHLSYLNPSVAYVRLKSYTNDNEAGKVEQLTPIYTIETDSNGGEIKVEMPKEEVAKKTWLVADDVLDTNGTIKKSHSILKGLGVNSENIKTTTLCNKNSPELVDYPCFLTYHNFWLVGGNMGRGDDFTTLPTGPLSIGVYMGT